MVVRVHGGYGQRGNADQWQDRVAGQHRDGHSRGGCCSCRDTGDDCRPDGNGSGVPSCCGGEHGHDSGGLGRLPAVAARRRDGGDSGVPCLRCGESVGYPYGQASRSGERVAAQAVWPPPPPTLPSVGRPRPPGRFRGADLAG
jgi:hypothetical protein